MIDQAERAASEELLAVYRRTLAHLLQQQEQYRSTGYVPLMVVNDIYNAREQIRQIKDRLRSQGAIVEDQSDDGASGDQNIPCPYPGVRAFTTSDSPYFFGREKEIKNLLLRLRLQRFLFVIGPSGSGKSSLVRAGLIVELDRTQAGLYQVLEMRPGATPLRALEQALGASFAQRQSYDAAVKALLAAAPPTQRILLIVDQFEEIFTQASAGDQEAFIAAIKALSQLDFCAVIVVMRADFYADLMVSSAWPLTLGQRIEVVPLAGAALRLAIEQPAIAVGVRIQPALLERLLADAAREPGVLPLVQETMRLLWEQMEDRGLTLQAYERLGGAEQSGLSAALGLMADAALEQLDNGRQKIARRILLRLVQFGEGRANTRRQQPIAKLRAADDDQTQFDATLQHLTTSRLLTLSGDALNDTRRIDIAHEALLHWSTFRIWIAERGAAEQTRRQLEAKVEEWVRMGSGDGGLLDAVELREAVGWLALPDSAELG
ncbi:MAG TPA: hypothetical protein VFU22_24715, partial [Roseiflexaceae bacterium]|nr:hypothetical protein [Roseiflexaceae bacterium]